MVVKYHQKTDHKEVNKKLYELTDWISLNLKGKPLFEWRQTVNKTLEGKREFKSTPILKKSVQFYNRYNKEDEVDATQLEEYLNHRTDEYLGVLKELGRLFTEKSNNEK